MGGITLGKYEILAEIGQEGMSTVYKARDIVLERYVALKVLAPSLAQKEHVRVRFHREAKVLSKFDHPNIVKIYDFSGLESDTIFIASEYVDGVSLKTLLEAEGHFEEVTALTMVREILKALSYIHSHHIIHRDVKPSNILVDKKGAILITDFGVARDDVSEMTQATIAGSMIGTLAYMPYEQINGLDIDQRVDIYAAGVTLYEFITGKKPFEESLVSKLITAISKGEYANPREIISSLHPQTESLITRALKLRAEDRFGTADEMLQACEKHPLLQKAEPQLKSITESAQVTKPIAPSFHQTENHETQLMPVQPQPKTLFQFKPSPRTKITLFLGSAGLALLIVSLFMARDLWKRSEQPAVLTQPVVVLPRVAPTISPSPSPAPEKSAKPSAPSTRKLPEKIKLLGPKTPISISTRSKSPIPTSRKFAGKTIKSKPSSSKLSTTPSVQPFNKARRLYEEGRRAQADGRIQEAIILLKQSIAEKSDYAEPYRELGKLYAALKDKRQSIMAVSYFETYLRLNPSATDRTKIVDIIHSLKTEIERY